MSETPTPRLPDGEIQMEFIHASGPGGQNVNKVATAVQLRFDVRNSPSLADEVKQRLLRLAGRRANSEGVLLIEAKRYRTREQNRADALERLFSLIEQASRRPKTRHATRHSLASKTRRIESKKRRGVIKKNRTSPGEE